MWNKSGNDAVHSHRNEATYHFINTYIYHKISLRCFTTTGFEDQGSVTYKPAHVINLDIKDNHEDATLGAFLILELCIMVGESNGY